jgi:ubiquinone/menaquinone biosynthesis C-methylase UbiE
MSEISNLYADLSRYYDRFCAGVDYAQQCDFAERAFAAFAESGGSDYLDLACGTGPHLHYMQQKGFRCSGLDNSAQMLELARRRCPQAELLLCDLAAFDYNSNYDLLSCFLYSIHYSHPLTAFTETLRRAYNALKPGGVFIFDMVDKNGIRNSDGVVSTADSAEGALRFQSGWNYRGHGEVLDLNLSIELAGDAGVQRWSDHHVMTATSIPEVKSLLQQAGFDVILLEHDFSTLREWDGFSFNVVVVAVRRAAAPQLS